MDADRFDGLARMLATTPARRRLLGALAGASLSSVLVSVAPSRAAARTLARRGTERTTRAATPGCGLHRYDETTLQDRGLGESTSNIDTKDLKPTKDRPARDRFDVDFFPELNTINTAVEKHDVTLHAASAYRSPKTQKGVSSAKESNHLAGHAIDFDFVYEDAAGNSHSCGWPCVIDKSKKKRTCLLNTKGQTVRKPDGCLEQARDAAGTKPGTTTPGMQALPVPVLEAILEVEKAGYRWGGRFKSGAGFDPIHFDDNLAKRNHATWERLVQELFDLEKQLKKHKGNVCPDDRRCDPATGQCVCKDENPCNSSERCCAAPKGICETGPLGSRCAAVCPASKKCDGAKCCDFPHSTPPFKGCCNHVTNGHFYNVCCPRNIDPVVGTPGACCAEDFPKCCTNICCRSGASCGPGGESCVSESGRAGGKPRTEPGIAPRSPAVV